LRQRASSTTNELEKAEKELRSRRRRENIRLRSTPDMTSRTISHSENLENYNCSYINFGLLVKKNYSKIKC
jgi:hypothetical protein